MDTELYDYTGPTLSLNTRRRLFTSFYANAKRLDLDMAGLGIVEKEGEADDYWIGMALVALKILLFGKDSAEIEGVLEDHRGSLDGEPEKAVRKDIERAKANGATARRSLPAPKASASSFRRG